jgi:hypothetical protein
MFVTRLPPSRFGLVKCLFLLSMAHSMAARLDPTI